MAQDKDQEPVGSNPGPDSPEPVSPGTDDTESVAPASDEEESSEEELRELQDAFDDGSDSARDSDDDERELVGAGAPVRSRSGNADGVVRGGRGATARSKKSEATPKQNRVEGPKRTTPAQFTREAVGELRKVVYPTGSQLANYFVVVLVFVLVIIGIVSGLDLVLGWGIFKIFA